MQTWLGSRSVPRDLPPTAVTIGAFDGVHRGHRVLLDRVVTDAVRGLMPVVVTFDPHPMAVIRPDVAPLLLTTLEHRLSLFAGAGIAGTLVLPFTPELAAQSAERFATDVLSGTLGARTVAVGRNFRFGHRAAGDVVLLAELGRELGFDVAIVDLAPLAAVGATEVSSTAIRRMVAEGDVDAAARALDRPHRVSGQVVHGDHRGRELGFPTANVAVPPGYAVPGDGVYAGWLRGSDAPGRWWPAAVSVGTNPTFGALPRRVEAHAIDAPAGLDLYGQISDVDFVARIRGMVRFAGIEPLVAQMRDDVRVAREILGS